MGLLDGVLGVLSGSGGGSGSPPIAQALESLVQQHGGLAGLVGQLTQGGLAQEVASWVGTGANMPVNGAQISQALGGDRIAQLAQQLGVDPQQAQHLLAQVLPHVINHLTPNGQLPDAGQPVTSGLLGAALSALSSRL